MDKSKEYIKMCEKLPDDMKQKFHGQVDWYVYIEAGSLKGVYIFQSVAFFIKVEKIIPLFRQDQLQEMIGGEVAKTLRDFFVFNMTDYRNNQPAHLFNSME